jgi:orotate phosphoribosyltransferase
MVASHMAALVPTDTDVLAGLELGGVRVATALSLAAGSPVAFVRREATEYGTERLAEGCEIAGRRVLVVEDVITTGGQVVASTEQLQVVGGSVEARSVSSIAAAETVPGSTRVPHRSGH